MMRLAFFYEPRILQLWQVVTNRAESLRTCSEFCQLSFLSSSSSCHGFEGSLKCKEQTSHLQMEAFFVTAAPSSCPYFPLKRVSNIRELGSSQGLAGYPAPSPLPVLSCDKFLTLHYLHINIASL